MNKSLPTKSVLDIVISLLDQGIIALGAIVVLGFMLFGCGDDNEGYELVPGNPTVNCNTDVRRGQDCSLPNGSKGTWQCGQSGLVCTAGSVSLNPGTSDPGTSSPSPDPTCKAVPNTWDMRTYNGCLTSVQLNGLYRTRDGLQFPFDGKAFKEDATGKVGELFYMVKPEAKDCGPVKVAMISSSGSLSIAVSANVEFYLLDPSMVNYTWQKIYGSAPDGNQNSKEMASLLVDIFETEVEGKATSLKGQLPPSIVKYQQTGATAKTEGAFCGYLYLLMRSL